MLNIKKRIEGPLTVSISVTIVPRMPLTSNTSVVEVLIEAPRITSLNQQDRPGGIGGNWGLSKSVIRNETDGTLSPTQKWTVSSRIVSNDTLPTISHEIVSWVKSLVPETRITTIDLLPARSLRQQTEVIVVDRQWRKLSQRNLSHRLDSWGKIITA